MLTSGQLNNNCPSELIFAIKRKSEINLKTQETLSINISDRSAKYTDTGITAKQELNTKCSARKDFGVILILGYVGLGC